MPLESAIERAVKAKTKGVLHLKLNVQGQTGWPDDLFLIPGGRPLFIEFKKPGEVPDPKQRHIHQTLKQLGYQVEVHDSARGAIQAITQALAAARVPKKRRQVPS